MNARPQSRGSHAVRGRQTGLGWLPWLAFVLLALLALAAWLIIRAVDDDTPSSSSPPVAAAAGDPAGTTTLDTRIALTPTTTGDAPATSLRLAG